jgi:predicted enzyme related to lactoylglutathione lyase
MNQIVHFEIGGTDTAKAAEFYGKMFGWSFAEGPVKYVEGAGLRGHLSALGHEPHNYNLVYVGVGDIAAAVAQATALGGKTLLGPIPLPNGAFAWIQDPTGTTIGLWQAAG